MRRRLLLSLIFTVIGTSLWAYDVVVDGIYYNLVDKAKEAIVTSGDDKYTGDITIPSEIKIGEISYNVTRIGYNAFCRCSNLTTISIPNSVAIIGVSAFEGCSGLANVTIPNSLTSIGQSVFKDCSGLTSIVIPNSVNSIEAYAFENCSGLTNIVIPNSVTSIGECAFSGCSGLTDISISSCVTFIDRYTFSSCSSLVSINIPNGVTGIDAYAFKGCVGLTSVAIPNSVTAIGSYVFEGCSGLTSITIPNSVTIIDSPFIGCSGLTTVSIGNGITRIMGKAFAYCKNLEEVYCYAEQILYTNEEAFADSYIEYCTLYVPESALDSYKSTAPWSSFGTIKAIKEENDITKIETNSVQITSTGNSLCITGAENVSHVEFYNLSGSYLGAEQVINGEASFETDENLVIVKIGDKSIKVKK